MSGSVEKKNQWCRVCRRTEPKSIFACRYKVHEANLEGIRAFYAVDDIIFGDLCDRCYRQYYKHRKETGQLNTTTPVRRGRRPKSSSASSSTATSPSGPVGIPGNHPSPNNRAAMAVDHQRASPNLRPRRTLTYYALDEDEVERGQQYRPFASAAAAAASKAGRSFLHHNRAYREEEEEEEEEEELHQWRHMWEPIQHDVRVFHSAGLAGTAVDCRHSFPISSSRVPSSTAQFPPSFPAAVPSRRKGSPHKSAARSTLMEEMQPSGWIWDGADRDSCRGGGATPMDMD